MDKGLRLRKTHQIVLGCAIALAFILCVEVILAVDDGIQINLFDIGDDRWSMTLRDGHDKVRVKSRGDIELSEGLEGPTIEVKNDGYFRIDAKENGVRRQLKIRGADSAEPTFEYRLDGRDHAFDDDAKKWLDDVLITCFRRGGFDAKARAGRIFDAGGLDAFEAELDEIPSDDVKRRYLLAILDRDELAVADTAALLESAGRRIRSDHTRMTILSSVSPPRLAEAPISQAYFATVRRLSSDHEKYRSLQHVMEPSLSEESWRDFFATAAEIGSDHEASRLASYYAGVRRGPLPETFPHFIEQISSDHSQRRAIQSLLEGDLESADRDALLSRAAAGVSSDHEAAGLLIFHASYGEKSISQGALDLLESIGSDNDQMRAAAALLDGLDRAEMPKVLNATDIQSDHLLAELLIEAAEFAGPLDAASPELQDAVRKAGKTISSKTPLLRVKQAWGVEG